MLGSKFNYYDGGSGGSGDRCASFSLFSSCSCRWVRGLCCAEPAVFDIAHDHALTRRRIHCFLCSIKEGNI